MARSVSARRPDNFPGSQTHSTTFNLNRLIDDVDAGLAPIAAILRGQATLDPASLVDGAGVTLTITVTGAALGDFVLFSAPYDLQGLTVTDYVSAANTVSIRIQNESTATIDLASGTWRAMVLPQAAFVAGIATQTANKVGDGQGTAV